MTTHYSAFLNYDNREISIHKVELIEPLDGPNLVTVALKEHIFGGKMGTGRLKVARDNLHSTFQGAKEYGLKLLDAHIRSHSAHLDRLAEEHTKLYARYEFLTKGRDELRNAVEKKAQPVPAPAMRYFTYVSKWEVI
jgi:hypothetical protein